MWVREIDFMKYCRAKKATGKLKIYAEYKILRIDVKMLTKQAKKLYYQDLLKKNKTDLSKTCKAIGSFVNMGRKSKSTACLNDNNALLFNLVKIAGTLKSFFTNIGLNIAKKNCEMKKTTDGISKK